jgi:pumilio RNA-binding family
MRARSEETINILQDIIISNFKTLIVHTYANYTIQVALEYWEQDKKAPIFKLFVDNFFEFSCQKYASNVVEKCLEIGSDSMVSKFIEEVCVKTKLMGKTIYNIFRIDEKYIW